MLLQQRFDCMLILNVFNQSIKTRRPRVTIHEPKPSECRKLNFRVELLHACPHFQLQAQLVRPRRMHERHEPDTGAATAHHCTYTICQMPTCHKTVDSVDYSRLIDVLHRVCVLQGLCSALVNLTGRVMLGCGDTVYTESFHCYV